MGAENSTQVSDTDLHGVCGGALCLAGHVDGGPGEDEGDGGIDAEGCEKSARVGNSGFLLGVFVGQ